MITEEVVEDCDKTLIFLKDDRNLFIESRPIAMFPKLPFGVNKREIESASNFKIKLSYFFIADSTPALFLLWRVEIQENKKKIHKNEKLIQTIILNLIKVKF